jgi:acyl carrier protein
VEEPTVTTSERDTGEIRDWLLDRVAFYLERPAAELSTDVKLVEYGLDSVYALTLCGDIEDEYGIEVDPTLAWDHPTIDAITALLRDKVAAGR